MADHDEPEPQGLPAEPVVSNVRSITDWVRRRESQRSLEEARRGLADHTWRAETKVELAEHVAELEALDLDGVILPEGDSDEAREGRAAILCARANRAHLRGDAESALADWGRAIEAAPHMPDAYLLRGVVLAAQGDTGAALADLDRATEIAPTDGAAFYRRGELFALMGDHDRALANYRRAQQLSPTMLGNLNAMATSCLSLNDRKGAIAALDRAIRAAPHFADFYLRRAVCYAGLGQADAALRDYDRSLERNPNQAAALRLRAYILQDRGLHDRAIADLARACEIEPHQVENLRALGRAKVLAHPREATLSELSALIEICPVDDLLYALRARLHQQAGDVAAATADFEAAARLDPACAAYAIGLAELRGRLEGPEDALLLVDQLLSMSPDDAQLHFTRGKLLVRHGRLEEAREALDTTLSLDPSLAAAHHERAGVLHKTGDSEGAVATMTRAITLDPRNGVYYAWRGCYRIPRGDPRQEIQADLDRAVELCPESAVPWFYRALFFETEYRFDEALSDIEKALAIQPEWGVLFYRRATCTRSLAGEILENASEEEGPTDEEEATMNALTRRAVADLEHCLELGVESYQVYAELYYARESLLDEDGALAALDGAIAHDAPGGFFYYLRSLLRRDHGDDAGAQEDIGSALARGYRLHDEREMAELKAYARGENVAGALRSFDAETALDTEAALDAPASLDVPVPIAQPPCALRSEDAP